MANDRPATLGALKAANIAVLPVRQELRKNLIAKIRSGERLFPGVVGYDDTVIPQLENAILSGQDIILLGERGQAKSRIIRALTSLLDEYTPVLAGCEIPENPYEPITPLGRQIVEEQGDNAPIAWVHRDDRYGEKLATPDITIADLIGEVDPIKVAEGRYLSDAFTIHYGLIPHTNRGIFALNELPDLSERIQVGLLNVMEERDVQIRGHKVRLPLDVLVVATANPEDYTNRGRIITPLKDRYGAQIRTHYPQTIEAEVAIMEAEAAHLMDDAEVEVIVPEYMKQVIAEITRLARRSPDVNQRSGVSVRASVADYEAMIANATRRAIRLGDRVAVPRVSDLAFIIPSLQGKVELETVEEGKDEQILDRLVQGAVVATFNRLIGDHDMDVVVDAFRSGRNVETGEAKPATEYQRLLNDIDGLAEVVGEVTRDERPQVQASAIEFVLEGLHLNKRLNKDRVSGRALYRG
ncbi:MAG: sigma 54-interacting transcriptional regulator [Dehalococcoidia bacterium]